MWEHISKPGIIPTMMSILILNYSKMGLNLSYISCSSDPHLPTKLSNEMHCSSNEMKHKIILCMADDAPL
jgi:hypothetical protein